MAARSRSTAPTLRIPNLAIHLNREVNKEGLKLNRQTHLAPLWGLSSDEGAQHALFDALAAQAGVGARRGELFGDDA